MIGEGRELSGNYAAIKRKICRLISLIGSFLGTPHKRIKRQMRWICVGGLLALSACAGPTVLSTPNSCATLVPIEWQKGVAGPELPADDSVGSWVAFGDAAIGKLDVANGRQRDTMHIITACEARDKKSVERATKSWLGRLFD